MKVPKKVEQRFTESLPKFKRILKKAQDRDVNESDTVSIIIDILSEVFGYDKYDEITSEYAIKNTFCDLAIRINGKIRFLIEAKAIGITLNENHLTQALTYGAKEGIDWIILTNGNIWNVYQVQMRTKLEANYLCTLNLQEINLRQNEDIVNLFILCKEGLTTDAISEYQEKLNTLNKYTIGSIISHHKMINTVRLQMKKLSPSIKITNEEILSIIIDEVLKRDVLESDQFKKAKSKVKKILGS